MGELFDDICRVVASQMPRRQAFKVLVGSLVGSSLALLSPGRANAAQNGKRPGSADLALDSCSALGVRENRTLKDCGAAASFRICCDDKEECCPASTRLFCCPAAFPMCCSSSLCCPKNTKCCGDTQCCDSNEVCLTEGIFKGVCAKEVAYVGSGGGK